MKTLTPETNELLDKLYNLRGNDSVILVEMEKQKRKAEETRERTTDQKKNLQKKIAELEKLHEELDEQGEKLKDVLSGIKREQYKTVLERLRIEFDPNALVEKLDRSLPKTMSSVEEDINKAEEELVKVENEMNNAITTIEEIGIRKDAAKGNQEKLNEYFELALSGRINITRDSITSLLEQFCFDEEEQREAAKILMFPEDALFIYDEKVKTKEKAGKSISQVIAEAKTESLKTEMIEKEQTAEENQTEEVKEELDPKDLAINTLKEEGIDYLDFHAEDLDKLIENFDEMRVKENIEYMKEKGIALDFFSQNVAFLYDKELKDKMELLIKNGKEANDIYLNSEVLSKYSEEELNNAINDLKANGLEPKEVPLMAY